MNHLKKASLSESRCQITAVKLIDELTEHPTTGVGNSKPLSSGQWSRRISSKYRLIYVINNEKVVVLLLSVSQNIFQILIQFSRQKIRDID